MKRREYKIVQNIEMDDFFLMCNKCRYIVDEDHVCDYNNTDNTSENNNNTNTEHNYECDFTEKLISEVFTREPLWNCKLPYKQRGPTDIKSLWSEVDACLGVSPGMSQNKWKNLRDRFVKEHNIQTTYTASGSAARAKKTSTWYLYQTLSFLTPTIIYRKTKSNLENVAPNQSMSLIEDSSFPSTSTQEHLSQQNVIKPQSSECNTPESPTVHKRFSELSNRNNKKRFMSESDTDQSLKSTKHRSSTPESSTVHKRLSELSNRNNKKRFMSESDTDQSLKSTKYRKKSNTPIDTHIEEALLKELELTRCTKEQCQPKSDKIENFVKYIETCLREMTSEISKRVMKRILMMLLDEDI